MKATERGKGRLHRSQLRSAGQSEEATPAYRPPQVTEDHQDIGKISFNATFLSAGSDLTFEMTPNDPYTTVNQPPK